MSTSTPPSSGMTVVLNDHEAHPQELSVTHVGFEFITFSDGSFVSYPTWNLAIAEGSIKIVEA